MIHTHTYEILNMEAKYFGGDKHGQLSGIMMKDALHMSDTVALQVLNNKHKTTYVAFTDFEEILK